MDDESEEELEEDDEPEVEDEPEEPKVSHRQPFSVRKPIIPPETVAAVKEEFSHFYSIDEEEAPEKPDKSMGAQRVPGKPKAPLRRKKDRPAFSLNDRFLYTREIFKGDPDAFNRAIEKITTFSRYEDAESHFRQSLGLEPSKNETDKAFLKMIKSYLG